MKELLPPHSDEAELGVLACILSDPDKSIPECVAALKSGGECFYDLRHRCVYDAAVELAEEGQLVDVITLQELLKSKGMLNRIGGTAFLSDLPDRIPSAANLPAYLELVQGKHQLRMLIKLCYEAQVKAAACNGDAQGVVDEVFRKVMDIAMRHGARDETPLPDLVKAAIVKMEESYERKGAMPGIATGLKDLDRITGGLADGDMTVVAGYPGSGKTSLAMNIAENAVIGLGVPAGVFSLEMSAVQLVTRFICSHARVNLRDLSRGSISGSDMASLVRASGSVSKCKLHFHDASDLSVFQFRAEARKMAQRHGVRLLVVDYLQLLNASGGGRKVESRQQEVADISRNLKAAAMELKLPVLALSQVNDDGKLRESRAIGQDADNVWILEADDAHATKDGMPVRLRIVKARNGPTGHVDLVFVRHLTRFADAAKSNSDEEEMP